MSKRLPLFTLLFIIIISNIFINVNIVHGENWSIDTIQFKKAAWSPDSSLLAVIDSENLYIYDRNGDLKWHVTIGQTPEFVAWSKYGNYVAVALNKGSRGAVNVYSRYGELVFSKTLSFPATTVDWNGESEITVGGWNGHVETIDIHGQTLWSFTGDIGDIRALKWRSLRDKLAVVTSNGNLVVFSNYGYRLFQYYLGLSLYSVSWSPDGSLIVAGGENGRLIYYTADGSKHWYVAIDPASRITGID